MGRLDLAGRTFGRLTIVRVVGIGKYGHTQWLCKCACGNKVIVSGSSINAGATKSCGCLQKEMAKKANLIHGMHRTPTHDSWGNMKDRCNNPKNKRYKDWGGRGIKVCEMWNKFTNFLVDMGEKPEGLTIDRIDNDGNYEPGNCRWATRKEQSRNGSRTKLNPLKVQIIKKLLQESQLMQKDIADIFNVSGKTVYSIKTGKTWEDIIYNPPIEKVGA